MFKMNCLIRMCIDELFNSKIEKGYFKNSWHKLRCRFKIFNLNRPDHIVISFKIIRHEIKNIVHQLKVKHQLQINKFFFRASGSSLSKVLQNLFNFIQKNPKPVQNREQYRPNPVFEHFQDYYFPAFQEGKYW